MTATPQSFKTLWTWGLCVYPPAASYLTATVVHIGTRFGAVTGVVQTNTSCFVATSCGPTTSIFPPLRYQSAENSCITHPEEPPTRVSIFGYTLTLKVPTVSSEGAEGGEWCQDTSGHRERVFRLASSSQVSSWWYHCAHQTL